MMPRRDPYAFADVDPEYAEQIELRQEVQILGRAVQARPESEVSKERLEKKYTEYIEVRKERGAVIPSPEIQARAVDPRSAEELAAEMALVEPPAPRLEPIRPVVIPPPVDAPEPLAPGLNFRADSGIRKLLFLGVVAAIVREFARA